MNKEKIKKFLKSKVFKIIIYILGVLVVASFIFQAGMMAGFKKAMFKRDWGDHYMMNFGIPEMGPRIKAGRFDNFGDLPNAHGAIGKIIKIELPSIVVLDDKDKTEKIIILDERTQIKKIGEDINANVLKIDESVVVIGMPNSMGQIEARLLRVIPAPFEGFINKIK